MTVPVTMPRLGESVSEGTVSRWLKNIGETVMAGEPLLEVSTDKVDTEIVAPASGTLVAIDVVEDVAAEVGSQLAVIELAVSVGVAEGPAVDPGVDGTPVGADAIDRPLEAARAKSGRAGRQVSPPAPPAVTSIQDASTSDTDAGEAGGVVRMSHMRQVIAARMMESLQSSAQLTTVVEVDITRIARLRETAKRDFEIREGVKLSFLPFFALAAIEALKTHRVLNSSVDMAAKTVTYHSAAHLGIAVDTDRGLMVPVIRDAGELNVAGLARKIADVAGRTRAGEIGADELSGGTFTITNTGSRGALFDTPILNQPQVGILGTGAVVKRPVVVATERGDAISIRSMAYLALSYDHRVVDGADAARFLSTVKERLEAGVFEGELGLRAG